MRSVAGIILAGSAFCLSAFDSGSPPAGSPEASRSFYLPYQYASFADDTALYADAYRNGEGLKYARRNAECPGMEGAERTVIAGTISHHLFIRNLIAAYFTALARHVHPRTIVLIGPNHHARGESPIALSALRWRTPFGFVEPDREIIRELALTGLASVEEEPFVNEHSIGALVPFIRRSFPGSMIVPVIYKKIADRDACARLGRALADLPAGTLVLASLDFSHYKTSAEAEREDAATLGVLTSLADNRIDEAFVDSRPALLTFISYCRAEGARRVEVVQHTNSGILSHNPLVPCTSYINTFIH